jgi:hypothetical protein
MIRTLPARSRVHGNGNHLQPRPKTRVIKRQVPPKAPLDCAEKTNAALGSVTRSRHQPNGIIVGDEFLPLFAATQAEYAAR